MIDTALVYVVRQLNAYLGGLYPSETPHAVLASLEKRDGAAAGGIDNKVLVSIVNVEREPAVGTTAANRPDNVGGYVRVHPPLSINVLMLLAAHFEADYVEALRFLSSTIAYFQMTPYLASQTSPAFPAGLERLAFEFVSLSLQEMNNLWGVRGSTYRPSVVVKMRMLTFDAGKVEAKVPAVRAIRNDPG